MVSVGYVVQTVELMGQPCVIAPDVRAAALALTGDKSGRPLHGPLCDIEVLAKARDTGLEAQKRDFSHHVMLAAKTSQNDLVFAFVGVSHNCPAIRCKMGYLTDVPV